MKISLYNQKYCLLFSFLFVMGCGQTGKQSKADTVIKNSKDTARLIHAGEINKQAKMEKFDIDSYEKKIRKDAGYEGYQESDSLYIQQYHTVKEGEDDSTFDREKVATYTNDLQYKNRYRTVKEYNHAGIIQHIRYYFATTLEIGLWQSFEADGRVVSEDNKDANYKFSLAQVLAFGKANKVDFTDNGMVDRKFSTQYKKYVWELRWNLEEGEAENQSLFRKVILDGDTGAILSDKKEMSQLIRSKNYH